MIKYNLNTINDWFYSTDNIIKVYRNNAICYYKIDSSSPSGQTPCFAVVDDITQYSDTEFEDVFNQADGKWYKLNNLNQYEEYGIYGSGRTITTYEGKLTIDDGDADEDYSTHYLTLVAQTDNVTFSYSTATSSNKLQYSVDSGSTWNDLSNGSSTSSINNGDRIMFKASGLTVNTERGIGKIIPSASASVEGNIMSLEYGDNFSGQTTIQNNYQFRKLFSGVTTITSAENMVLPATTVKQQCYSQMFQGCTNLVKTPKTIGSSAMTWSGQYCFSNMFSYCTSLTTVPSGLLPAMNLGTQCYWYMFEGCSGLTAAPDLPATTTASQCYQGMLSGCSSLNYITVLTTNNFTMTEWVSGVAASGTFVKNPNATWSSCGQNAYPCGWTVQDYVEPTPIKYEYIYSGGSWVNVGEVSGSTYIEYLERDSSHNGYVPLGEYFTQNTVVQMDFQMTQAKGFAIIGDYFKNDSDDWRVFLNYDVSVNNWLIYDFTNSRNYYNTGDWSKRFNIEIGNYYIKDLNTGNYLINTTAKTGFSRPNQMYLFHLEGTTSQQNTDYGRIYSVKIYQNNVLVKDYIPWTDGNGNYGIYDNVSSSVTESVGAMTGATGGTVEYPIYYDEMQDPPNNLTFSSMTEAQSYECPWWGMTGIIDNTDYLFCETNNWLTKYTYQEVSGEYICDSGNKYKKMQEYDRLVDGTLSATTNYVIGDLIESGSPDCSIDYSTLYLTLQALESGTFGFSASTVNYSTDSGSTWNTLAQGNTISVNQGDEVLFKMSGAIPNSNTGIGTFTSSGRFNVYGNIMSMQESDNFATATTIANYNYYFKRLFAESKVVSAENMVLPATTLRNFCYNELFKGSTYLTTPPKIFPATALTQDCYSHSFRECTSLTKSPVLPALTVARASYGWMFQDCTSLSEITCLATNTSAQYATYDWVKNVASSGTFYKNPNKSWSRGTSGIPSNWTIQDYSG